MNQKDVDKLISAYNQAKSARGYLESVYKDAFDWVDPIRGQGLNGQTTLSQDSHLSQAANVQTNLYDCTAADCAKLLASSIMGGLTPSNAKWFDIDVAGQPDNRDQWLDESSDACWHEIHAANFDAVGYESIYDSIIAGNVITYIDYNEKTQNLTFEEWPLAGTYFSASVLGGQADTVYRCKNMTAEQAFNEYNVDPDKPNNLGVHQDIFQAIRNGDKSKKFEFVQCIYPRQAGDGYSAQQLPFASVHIDLAHRMVVRESGYHEFPCAIPRWYVIPGGDYATGPVWSALPDIKTLNQTMRIILQNAELQMAGMYVATDDGVINPATIKVGPREIIVVSDPAGFAPITPSGNIGVGEVLLENLRLQVRKLMMVENLQLPQGEQMTATEINVRLEILRQLLGPIFGRLQAEWLKPIVERCFGLLLRAGKIEPPPDSLAGQKLNIRYLSPLARSQRISDVAAMDRYEMALGVTAQLIPSVLDLYDWDEAERERAYLLGVPQKLIPNEAKVKQMREDREAQKAEIAQQQQQQMMEIEQAKRPQQ